MKMLLRIAILFGCIQVNNKIVYKRTLNNIYQLLERLYLKDGTMEDNAKNEEGVKRFYQILILLNKKSKDKRQIPFICRTMGNA